MARYVVTMQSMLPAAEAFAYLADVERFGEWDRASFSRPAPRGVHRDRTRHTTSRCSVDEIRVEPHNEGSLVTYDARLMLRGIARILDPALGVLFRRIGDRAVPGLRRALRAEVVGA